MIELQILLVALFLADGVTTVALLKAGGREANPVMAGLMNAMGIKPALIVTRVILIAVALVYTDATTQIGAAILFGAVVANNLRVIHKLRNPQ